MILIGISMKQYGFVILLLCLVGFSFVPVYGQIGIPSHSIVNPDSVSHNFYERETVKGVSRVMCLRHLSDIESDVTRLLE